MKGKKRVRNDDGGPRHVTPAGRRVFPKSNVERSAASALTCCFGSLPGTLKSSIWIGRDIASKARDLRAVGGLRILLVGTILFSALVACSGEGTAPIERATVALDGDARTHVCRLSYLSLNREIQCDQVATAMQTEFRIPTSVRVVVQPSKETRYDEVGRLIQSLNAIGYVTEFPSQ